MSRYDPFPALPSGPDASALQSRLANRVELSPLPHGWRMVVGIDLAMGRHSHLGRAALVVWDRESGTVVEELTQEGPLDVPYRPGFLAYREAPLILECLERLRTPPDLLMFDGQGIAHPRGLGIAAHLGVHTGLPSVGVAKSPLFGRWELPGLEVGCSSPILAPDGRAIGSVIRSRAGGRPLWVSPGHRCTVADAEAAVLACLRGHRLPEPTHLADRLSKRRPDLIPEEVDPPFPA